MSTLICPVTRKIAGVNAAHLVELVNWSGVALMVHPFVSNQKIIGQQEWTCSHERTGFAVAHGPSPETALALAISKIRGNYAVFLEQTARLDVLNP